MNLKKNKQLSYLSHLYLLQARQSIGTKLEKRFWQADFPAPFRALVQCVITFKNLVRC